LWRRFTDVLKRPLCPLDLRIERVLSVANRDEKAELSPEGIARFNRKRLAAEEGAALADVERQAIDIRKNMARLRELRDTKEAADATLRASLPAPSPKNRRSKLARRPIPAIIDAS
jgi:hypothetical protein